jgi:hypothetical protein
MNGVLYFQPHIYPDWNSSFLSTWFSIQPQDFTPIRFITLSIFITFLQALLINGLFNRFKLTEEITFLPGFLFIIVTSAFPGLILLSPATLSFFILLLITSNLIQLFDLENAVQKLFFTSFFIGLGAFIYSPLLLFIFLIIIAFPLLKRSTVNEFIIIPFGYLIPLYIITLYFFFTNSIELFSEHLSMSLPQIEIVHHIGSPMVFAPLGFIFILLIIGFVQNTFEKSSTSVRLARFQGMFATYFFLTLLIFLFINTDKTSFGIYFMFPVTFFLTTIFVNNNSKLYNFLFYGLIVVSVFQQIYLFL